MKIEKYKMKTEKYPLHIIELLTKYRINKVKNCDSCQVIIFS